MKTKALVVAITLLIAWGLKRHYAGAGAEELSWILTPTTYVVSILTGTPFEWRAGEGYFSRDRLFLIEKSCAGINFMIAAFVMLVLVQVRLCRTVAAALSVFLGCLSGSYAAAVIVNAVRIAIAMHLAAHPAWLSAFSADDVHRIEGIVVYFVGLLVLHRMWTGGGETVRGAALPLAMYYGVTLVLPLANGAAHSEAFLDHAVSVLVLPLLVILLLSTVRLFWRPPRIG